MAVPASPEPASGPTRPTPPDSPALPAALPAWAVRPFQDLLADHGLAGVAEDPFENDGWSGARFGHLARSDGARFVVKRTSLAADWIARQTRDDGLREAVVAALVGTGRLALPAAVVAPYLGAGADGAGADGAEADGASRPSEPARGAAILMPDLSAELIAWDGPGTAATVSAATLDRVLSAVAAIHAGGWAGELDSVPWCPLPERLGLLARPAAEGYAQAANPVGRIFLDGWAAFERQVPAAARDLIGSLEADPAPLLAALGRLPAAPLHGDLKLANVAILDHGRIGLIDWQMTLRAPVAVELGWLLVANVAQLPDPPEAALERYRARLLEHPGGAAVAGDWSAQVDLASIVGLLMRGWRKGLDAEAGLATGWGAPATEDLARWTAAAVEAADRRL